MSLKAVHYINQFYAGIGGETMADTGFGILEEKKGPALGLEQLWNGEMTISKVVYCGDNYVNTDENYGEVKEKLAKVIREEKPDVFIAGPAFNAGRYGVACAKVCDYVRSELGVPSVTCMWHENPAIDMYVENNYIVPSTETAVGMRKTLPALAKLALKLARKEKIGTAHAIALFTTGGLVPVGNPDKIKQAFAVSFGIYDMTGLDALKKGVYESIHGGYDTTAASADPHRLVPLDALLD